MFSCKLSKTFKALFPPVALFGCFQFGPILYQVYLLIVKSTYLHMYQVDLTIFCSKYFLLKLVGISTVTQISIL